MSDSPLQTVVALVSASIYDPEGDAGFQIASSLSRDELFGTLALTIGMLSASIEDSCATHGVTVEQWLERAGVEAAKEAS